MQPTDFILCLVDVCGGSVSGRTLLQKRAFFVTELLGLDFGLKFDAHYYGPYSATVEGVTAQLKNLGFLQESSTGYGILSDGFEMRRYDYSLTEDGRSVLERLRQTPEHMQIKQAAEQILKAGNPNYLELSIAAKAYFLLKKREKGGMSRTELIKQAEKYRWNISAESISRAITFLTSIGLAAES